MTAKTKNYADLAWRLLEGSGDDLADLRVHLLTNGYVPLPASDKGVYLYEWSKLDENDNQCGIQPTVEMIDNWSVEYPHWQSTSVRCGEIVGIDCDVRDKTVAEKLQEMARRRFGKAFPTRVGNPPKFLMMCRTSELFSKLMTDKYVQPDGGESRVEVLANGQQFIAYGIHPKTGQPYRWFGGDPQTVSVSDLLEVSREQVVEFLREAESILAAQPDWTVDPKAARANYDREREEPKNDFSGEPTDWTRLERALDALTDVNDYDQFYRIIAALKDGTDNQKRALALAFKWAAGYPDLFDPIGLQKKWDSFKRGSGVGLGTIYHLAREAEAQNASGFGDVSPKALLVPSADFVKDFDPPEYLVKGLLRRRFAYAITARTGDGKTAICILLVACVDQGAPFAGHEIRRRGLCIYFAGENPDDIRMRWLAMVREMGREPGDFNVKFVPGVYKLHEIKDRIRQEVGDEEVALIVIDTSAAYFPGTDENNNVELGNHARMLRKQFVELPGGPCIVICCHPVKHAADDNLQPRGGGAYVAELDGNLTCIRQGNVAEVHWQTKFRGPDFAPMGFKLKTVTDHPLLKDSDGDPMPTVVALVLSEQDKENLANANRKNEDVILLAIHRHIGASLADLARVAGWMGKDGHSPEKMKVRRAIETLVKHKLIKKHRESWKLTTAGEKEFKRLTEGRDASMEGVETTDDVFDAGPGDRPAAE